MKTNKKIKSMMALLVGSISMYGQNNDLVMNGSFENTSGKVQSTGAFILADSISSSNNTTVDLFSKDACGKDYKVPENYMGSQDAKTGNNYAGIIAYYADDAGFFKTKPGYRKYSEYVQFTFREPLIAGKVYAVTFNVSLAEKSAYAVSGLGAYFSPSKMDVKNNSFMKLIPHIVCTEVIVNKGWTTVNGTYVAKGGEQYMTLGCFDAYMITQKVALPNTNDSRKAYYYIDDVSMTPQTLGKEDFANILAGSCFQLDNLNFETDKAVILSTSYAQLKSLSDFLKTYPYVLVYIDGFTDKTGTTKHNDKLSEERALAVKAFLVKDGIAITRLEARSHGEDLPIDTKNDNSQVNRRVEITICMSNKI